MKIPRPSPAEATTPAEAATSDAAASGAAASGTAVLVRMLEGRRTVALTGAGCSTESGIPDYRGTDSERRTPTPIQYRDFVSDPEARRRYWARSAVGWPRMARARPNPAHRALARLEAGGRLAGVITQNVDGLHQEAGSRRVVEIHGSLSRVRCLDCGEVERRSSVQERLLRLNPGWMDEMGAGAAAAGAGNVRLAPDGDARIAPDGDAPVPESAIRGFRVPDCRACGGVLKPAVVFFGEFVPAALKTAARDLFSRAEALLVVGSSLTVHSGLRYVRMAGERRMPVGIVNLGPTRGDGLARVRVEGRAGRILPRLARRLADRPEAPASDACGASGAAAPRRTSSSLREEGP